MIIRDDLEIVWNEIKTYGKKVLIGNIYVPPNNEEQFITLDARLKNEAIALLGDFHSGKKS